MNDLKVALRMLPMIRGLYDHGVLDIVPSYTGNDYIQLKESKFRTLFPDIEPDKDGYFTYYVDGVRVIAIADKAL